MADLHESTIYDKESCNFHEMELDDRILKAIAKLGWTEPTLIQQRAIPLLLEGKDVLIRARTGSGKTAAFAIPVIQKILNSKVVPKEQAITTLVLAPSKELCQQICEHLKELTKKCSREVRCIDISPQMDINAQKPLLIEQPDIVVATPARALAHLSAKTMKLKSSLETLIIDEADLVFSFGYEAEIKNLLPYLSGIHQSVLASATLSEDVVTLKKLVLNNPVTLKLEEPALAPSEQLSHYYLGAEEEEKATIIYALFKLCLVRGKTIIFVNSVDKCYKLKLFLEQFGIPACVLNSELPASIRCHSVHQFNQGTYNIIIASDEHALEGPVELKKQKNQQMTKRKKDKDSGVSRGIDFQRVSNVINFDFPLDVNAYVHRVGRTARGKNQGTALSFVSLRERCLLGETELYLQQGYSTEEDVIKPYEFKLEEVEGFRYRAKDAWRAVTRIAVREARLKEIKQEILNSQKLKSYFVDNPHDFKSLRHDKALHTVKIQPHLADVPDYIVPPALKTLTTLANRRKRVHGAAFVPKSITRTKAKYKAKTSNPLNVDLSTQTKRRR